MMNRDERIKAAKARREKIVVVMGELNNLVSQHKIEIQKATDPDEISDHFYGLWRAFDEARRLEGEFKFYWTLIHKELGYDLPEVDFKLHGLPF